MTLAKKDLFQMLIRSASALPPTTGTTAHYQKRLESAGSGCVILADVSSSMAEPAGARTKIEVLREALASAPPARIIAFSSIPVEIFSPEALPYPSGGTALHLALAMAATMRPERTLVVSDGRPDGEGEAMAAASVLPGTIDVIYCGPDSDAGARDFLMRLARTGGGRYVAYDLQRGSVALAPAIRKLLGSGT